MTTVTCTVKGCTKKHVANGYCWMHYARMRRYNSLEPLVLRGPVLKRIKAKLVVKSNGCWVYTGKLNRYGYAQIFDDNRVKKYVHRIMYEDKYGPLPPWPELVSDHLCRCRACCNPDHIELVTPAENIRRGNTGAAARARLMALTPEERSARGRKGMNIRWNKG